MGQSLSQSNTHHQMTQFFSGKCLKQRVVSVYPDTYMWMFIVILFVRAPEREKNSNGNQPVSE